MCGCTLISMGSLIPISNSRNIEFQNIGCLSKIGPSASGATQSIEMQMKTPQRHNYRLGAVGVSLT